MDFLSCAAAFGALVILTSLVIVKSILRIHHMRVSTINDADEDGDTGTDEDVYAEALMRQACE